MTKFINYIITRYHIKKLTKDVNYFLYYPRFLLKKLFKTKVTLKTIKISTQIITLICDNYIYQCKRNIIKKKYLV